jgi:hypothetical protein
MHFICLGDYLPLHTLEKNIKTFQKYQDKSKSILNMLKEK